MHMKIKRIFERTLISPSVRPILVLAMLVFITLRISRPVYIMIAIALPLAKKQLPQRVFYKFRPYLHPSCWEFDSTLKNPSNL